MEKEKRKAAEQATPKGAGSDSDSSSDEDEGEEADEGENEEESRMEEDINNTQPNYNESSKNKEIDTEEVKQKT